MRFWIGLFLLAFSLSLWATPSVSDIRSAMDSGNYAKAETLIRQVLADHPGSAHAHYIYAQILAHEAHYDDATDQALQAKKLDPAISFTNPEKFRRFEAELLNSANHVTTSQHAARTTTTTTYYPAQQVVNTNNGTHTAFPWFGFIVFLLVVAFLISLLFRRTNTYVGPAASNMGGGMGAGPAYGGGGSGPVIINNTGGGGMGAGLGGFAAGMVAGELLDRAMDRPGYGYGGGYGNGPMVEQVEQNTYYDSNSSVDADQALQNDPIDYGTSDNWGGSDNSSDLGGDNW